MVDPKTPRSDAEWDTFLGDLRSWLMQAGRRRCADLDALEDAVQDSLGALWEKWSSVRDPAAVRAYALTIVRNRLRTRLARGVRVQRMPADWASECADLGEDPSRLLTRTEDRRWVVRELALLPSPYREALELRRAGHTPSVVAERLGVTQDRARRLTYEAVRQLRRRARGREQSDPP